MHINEVVDFCIKNEIRYDVHYGFGTFVAGGHEDKNVNMTSYRVDQSEEVIQDVWYSQYNLRFNVKTGEVYFPKYSESEQKYDIRNHEAWGK